MTLDTDLYMIMNKIKNFKKKIADNLKTEHNQNGLLTSIEKDYYDCLKIENKKLETLFKQDEEYWKDNLASKK